MQHILKISEAATLALHSMIVINNAGGSISLRLIAEELAVSPHHLSKVLQRLVKSQFLKSTKGVGGGFVMIKNSVDITFLDIYEAIEGKFFPSPCLFGGKQCRFKACTMGKLLASVNEQVYEYLSKTRLSEFSEDKIPVAI